MAGRAKKSSEDEGLGWLEGGGGESSQEEPRAQKKKPAQQPPAPAQKKPDEVLDWLAGETEGGDTLVSPEGAGSKVGDDAGSLGWLGDDDSAAPALLEDDDESTPGMDVAGSESMFSSALDDFFDSIDAKEEEDEAPVAASTTHVASDSIVSGRTIRTKDRSKLDQKIDKVVSTLIRYLTRKEPIKESQLDSIFRLSVGKMVDVVNAELIIVYFLNEQNKITFAHIFYAKGLFKGKGDAEAKFKRNVEKLSQLTLESGTGIVGRAIEKKSPITSLDARNDPDFKNYVGDATGVEVRTMLTVPLVDGQEVYGAIQVMNKDPLSGEEFFSYHDLKLVEEVAGYGARIIHHTKSPKLQTTDEEMARYVARLGKTEVMDLTKADIEWDDRLWEIVGTDAIQKYMILPLKALTSKALSVVMVNPLDFGKRTAFEASTEKTIEVAYVALKAQIEGVLGKKFKKEEKSLDTTDLEGLARETGEGRTETVELKPGEDEESGPIIKLANRIIEDAYARGASDIHIEPYENDVRVRYRVDGNLEERMKLPKASINPLISRIKIMSNLDISERRLPQDGKIKFKKFARTGLDIDLRVATGPMTFGEKCVMRLLLKGSISLGLDAMGFSPQNLEGFRWASKQPYGMVLCCGPTGSGKTTTLYSALSEVNTIDVNIMTAEDPVEYPLNGINQMQMHKDIGLTFSSALRCYMRMDPDIILVGEIRDLETAECAIEASLTGHLLLSTLHTNDSAGTVTRFVEMGVEPFLVASCLLLISAQRLGRRLCKSCKQPGEPTDAERKILMNDPRPIDKPILKAKEGGCEKCGGSGYKGRVGIHEIMCLMGDMGTKIRELVNKNVSSDVLKSEAVKLGMKTMWQDALWKVKEGITDLREVISIVRAD